MKIKSILLAGILSAGVLTVAQAKGDGDNPGGFGLKGGVGLSNLSFGNDDPNATNYKNAMKIGGMLGVSYEKRIGNSFAIDGELLFANKGNRQTFDLPGNNNSGVLKNNIFTVDVPISAKFYIGDNFNIYAGPYASFIVGGRLVTKTTVNGKESKSESEDYFSDDFKVDGEYPLNRFDFGANVGLEFVTNGGFGVGARFQKGFMDLTNDNYRPLGIANDGKNVTNTGIQVYALIRF